MSDAAITAIVTGTIQVVGMIVGFLTIWVKLKYGVDKAEEVSVKTDKVVEKVEEAATKAKIVEKKLDTNTILTKRGNDEAISSARNAANVATEAKQVVDSISKRLNGGIDSALAEYLEPINKTLNEHGSKIEQLHTKLEQLISINKQIQSGS